MNTLSFRTLVRNAAAVFSGCYGAVTRQAAEAGCSRQTVYEHARQVEQRLQPIDPPTPPETNERATPVPLIDESTRRQLAVTAFAMGISTRQIEDLLRVILPDDGPDHATIARWVAAEAKNAKIVLQTLDAACISKVQTAAIDEIFLGDDRPWSASNPQV
jgi:hypothetical protein